MRSNTDASRTRDSVSQPKQRWMAKGWPVHNESSSFRPRTPSSNDFLQWRADCHARSQRLEQMDDGAIPSHFSEHVSHYRYARACALMDRNANPEGAGVEAVRRWLHDKPLDSGAPTSLLPTFARRKMARGEDRDRLRPQVSQTVTVITAHVQPEANGSSCYRTIPRSL